jgi:membrane dipeptidase
MTVRPLVALATFFLLSACEPAQQTDTSSEQPSSAVDLAARAREITRNSIIVDTHIDVPYRIHYAWEDVSRATDEGDFDYPRAIAGGLNAPFMSIYTPAKLEEEGRSKEVAEELIELINRIVADSPDKFAIALSPADVEAQFAKGIISLPMGMENGSPIEGDLANLQSFFDRGIRYITLTHSLSNHISDSSYDDNKRWGGLSEFGVDVVNIASHSSARHFTPGWERNIDDDMIVRLAENGGVVMINYGSAFLTRAANDYDDARDDAFDAYREDLGIEETREIRAAFNADYEKTHGPYPYATLDETLDHFDHVVNLTSIDHVGIGTDYDGVGDSLPIGLKDVSSYPNLVEGLLRRGYSEEDVKKVLGANLLRVWRQVESVAASM